MVIIDGEPGAGKSTLIQAFVDRLAGAEAVLWGACDPLSTPRPLGPLHDLAASLGEGTREALAAAQQPHEIFDAVNDDIRVQPSVLVVDDLHWADQGTIDLLRYLLRRIGATSSLVIGAVRRDEVDVDHPLRALLGDIARSPDASSMSLSPLTLAAVRAIIEERPIDAVRLRRLTGGNPFFVTEMLDHEGDDVPVSIRDAILSRTTGLDAESWDLLHLLVCAPE